ncbi:MAG: hypothetical protein M3Q79_04045, partial [bacterium]|nr:hypothetical protein [bacterium]
MDIDDLKNKKVGYVGVGGFLFESDEPGNKPTLVIFNQWRSGAASLFSKYLALFTFELDVYGRVLFIDRIGSGGQSRNKLTKLEEEVMLTRGDNQFADEYCLAIKNILKASNIFSPTVLGGSSAGSAAAIATALASSRNKLQIKRVIVVEPSGLMPHGLTKNGYLSVPHA